MCFIPFVLDASLVYTILGMVCRGFAGYGRTFVVVVAILTVPAAHLVRRPVPPSLVSFFLYLSPSLSAPPCLSLSLSLSPQAAKGVDLKAGLQASLSTMFDAAMLKAWPLAKSVGITSSSTKKCMDYKNGDFQCNAAMSLFKALKVGRSVGRWRGLFFVFFVFSVFFCTRYSQTIHHACSPSSVAFGEMLYFHLR